MDHPNEEREEDCIICLEEVLVPCRLKNFSCWETPYPSLYKYFENSSSYSPTASCLYGKYLCLLCAMSYLQLDKDSSQRDSYKKCLVCPTRSSLRTLTVENSLQLETAKMDQPIPRSITTCPLCKDYFVFLSCHTQKDVVHHFFSHCPKFWIECFCKRVLPRMTLFQSHILFCSAFKECTVCHTHVPEILYTQHQSEKHDLHQCFQCSSFVTADDMNGHVLHECPERLRSCNLCHLLVRYSSLNEHVQNHFHEISASIHDLQTRLTEEFNKIKYLQSSSPDTPFPLSLIPLLGSDHEDDHHPEEPDEFLLLS